MWKSSKTKVRCIIDAKPENMFFNIPPSVGMCSPKTSARIEIERDDFWPFETTYTFDRRSCTRRRSIAKVPRTCGKALTTKSCD